MKPPKRRIGVERSNSNELRMFAKTLPIPWLVFTLDSPDLNERASNDLDLDPFILAYFTCKCELTTVVRVGWGGLCAD